MSDRTPRPYQQRAVDDVWDNLRNHRRQLLVAPTGAGKTYMMCMLADRMTAMGGRVAWFAHRRELVTQAVRSLDAYGMRAGYRGLHKGALVQVASVQGSLSRGEAPEADLVVLDEAHHFGADEWKRIPEAYNGAAIVGATATPERGDGRPLDHLFERIVVAAQPQELLAAGVLTPCDVIGPSRPLRAGQVAQRPCDAWMQYARNRKTVVFAPSVEGAEAIAREFRDRCTVEAAVVHGGLPSGVRDRILRDFTDDKIKVLVNVYVLTEGWDCPDVECVILARRFTSVGQYIQCVGRGVRSARGKSRCTLLDLTGSAHVHGHPLSDRTFSLDGEPISSGGARTAYCPICGAILAGKCERCGREPEPRQLTITNDPLVKFAHLQQDDTQTRVNRLARWMVEAMKRGAKWQSALYRYKGAYFAMPPKAVVSEAYRIARGG